MKIKIKNVDNPRAIWQARRIFYQGPVGRDEIGRIVLVETIFHSYATAHVKSNPDAHLLIRCLDIINNPPVSSRDCPPTTPISDTREFKLSALEYDIEDYLETQQI